MLLRGSIKSVSENLLIGSIILLAAGGRFWGLSFGLPYLYRPDEPVIVRHTLRFFSGDFNPHFFNYPTFYMYFLYGLDACYLWLTGSASSVFIDPTVFFLIARISSATLGVVTVLVVYRLASKTYAKFEGIAASFLLGLTFLHARDSHFGTVDVPLTLLIMAAHLPMLRITTEGKPKHYLAAGMLIGLAAATKYSAAILLVSLFTSYVIADRQQRVSVGWLLGAVLASGITFFFASPYCLLDWQSCLQDLRFEARHMVAGHGVDLGIGLVRTAAFSLRYGMGLPLLALSVLGGFFLLRRRKKADLLLLVFPICYYLLMARWRTVFVRYAIPLLPFLAIWAAVGLRELAGILEARKIRARRVLVIIIAILAVLPSAISLAWHNTLISRTDTRTLARTWIIRQIPAGSKIALPDYGPQLLKDISFSWSSDPRTADSPPYSFLIMQEPRYDEEYLRENGVQYLVAQYGYTVNNPFEPPSDLRTRKGIKLLAQISPYSPGSRPSPLWDSIDKYYVPYGRFAGVEGAGPLIEIYKMAQAHP